MVTLPFAFCHSNVEQIANKGQTETVSCQNKIWFKVHPLKSVLEYGSYSCLQQTHTHTTGNYYQQERDSCMETHTQCCRLSRHSLSNTGAR